MEKEKASESEILELLKRRDSLDAGLRLFIKVYGKDLYGFIITLTHQQADADEIFQETLIKLMDNVHSFKGLSSLKTWVWKIARNKTIDFQRAVKRLCWVESSGMEEFLKEDPYFNGDEWLTRLHSAVSELPPTQREVFILRYFENMNYNQIAEITEKNKGTLKTSFHYAAAKVSEILKSHL